MKAFIQARQGSTRLPNKIYADLNGAPVLFHVINAAKSAKLIDDVVVISPDALPDLPEGTKQYIFRGNEMDVLGRYGAALKEHPCDYIVRLTGDCPLLDPYLIDFVVGEAAGHHYCANVLSPTFPDGQDIEVISRQILESLDRNVRGPYDREHVTTWIRDNSFAQNDLDCVNVRSRLDFSALKISIDTEDDLELVRQVERAWNGTAILSY